MWEREKVGGERQGEEGGEIGRRRDREKERQGGGGEIEGKKERKRTFMLALAQTNANKSRGIEIDNQLLTPLLPKQKILSFLFFFYNVQLYTYTNLHLIYNL